MPTLSEVKPISVIVQVFISFFDAEITPSISGLEGSKSCFMTHINVGDDFYEFDVIDIDSMEYQETLMIQHNLLLEVTLGGADVQRILAEMSCNLPAVNRD